MQEEVIIVNEKDEVLGSKLRSEITPHDIYRVSSLWITNSRGEILLAQRSLRKDTNPGKWGPSAAGTHAVGETYLSNIIKEAKEELGLENISPVAGPKELIGRQRHYFRQRFFLKLDVDLKDLTLQKEEVAAVKWFSKEELKTETAKHPDNFLLSIHEWVRELP